MAFPTTHCLSINIYGRGDASLGDGPSHMGIALYTQDSSTCFIHHIRNPNDTDFIYDPRPQPPSDPALRGRCELASFTSNQNEHADRLLTAFGEDSSNIPEFGIGNCQDWVAGAVGVLEREGLVKTGEVEFWGCMINRSADEMRDACLRTGRAWIPGPESTFEGEPDARFHGKSGSTVRVGKLSQNEAFRARMQTPFGWQQSEDASEQERPLYVSSPFFSMTNG